MPRTLVDVSLWVEHLPDVTDDQLHDAVANGLARHVLIEARAPDEPIAAIVSEIDKVWVRVV